MMPFECNIPGAVLEGKILTLPADAFPESDRPKVIKLTAVDHLTPETQRRLLRVALMKLNETQESYTEASTTSFLQGTVVGVLAGLLWGFLL